MWRLPSRPIHPLRDGAALEGWCVVCAALRALPEQELSRAIRVDLPRDFDVHRHCLVACAQCRTPYVIDTWYPIPRGPWVAEEDVFDGAMNALGRGATRAADAMENGVRWAMGHKPVDRRDPRAVPAAPPTREDRELDAFLSRESSILDDPLEAKFRALEEAARKKKDG